MKCTALTGVTPGTIGWSVKDRGTVTVNACVAAVLDPPVSVAVTVTNAVPSDTGVTVTRLPDTATDATDGAELLAP